MTMHLHSQQDGFVRLAPVGLPKVGCSGSAPQSLQNATCPSAVGAADQGPGGRPSPGFFGGAFRV
jgi:hypothetical protein